VATQTGAEVGRQEADAAMHRLTRLVTRDTELPALFAAVAADVAKTIGADAWLVRVETGGRTTVLASHGDPTVEPTVRSPVVVDGLTWGFVCARPRDGWRVDAASLVDDVAALVALAVARASATRSLRRLSGELASLRHVATLAAEGSSASDLFATERSSPSDFFAAVVQAIDVDAICVLRIDEDRFATVIASLDASTFAIASRWAIGNRWGLDEAGLIASVVAAGRPVRIDDVSTLDGVSGAALRDSGIHSAVGAPIVVNGAVWGVIWVGSRRPEPLSGATEMRLRDFTELAAAGVANAESRTHLRRQADAEASLRRVAVLTAEGATPTELLDVIAAEAARILDGATVAIVQYQDRSFHVVAGHNVPILEVGSTWPIEQSSFAAAVRETRAAVRIDDVAGAEGVFAEAARTAEMASLLGAPIVVDRTAWGMIVVGYRRWAESRPAFTGWYTSRQVSSSMSIREIESRLASFSELTATAISRAQAQSELRALAREQAALQRVATLIARETDAPSVFDAVCAEAGALLGAVSVTLFAGSEPAAHWKDGNDATASSAEATVFVEGRRWGALVAWFPASVPEAAEQRLERFTELIAITVANERARSELIASRVRLMEAGDEARRRIERDLHDGTQQRLVALVLHLHKLRVAIPAAEEAALAGLEQVERELKAVIEEVHELSRGVHPAQLAHGGLRPSLRALARRSPIPVEVAIDVAHRPPPSVETAIYYVVSEAMTNAIKHSRATVLSVTVVANSSAVSATVADDGVGGAEIGLGSGLTGLSDRVAALTGRFSVVSPRGGGTTISVEFPVATQ
jgi:signal transduction histidine kinase